MTLGHTAQTSRRIRTRRRRARGLLAALAVAVAAGLAAQSLRSSPVSLPSAATVRSSLPAPFRDRARLGEADGSVPRGTSVFDDRVPGVAKLDPALLGAVRRAATDAGNEVRFVVDSGWRSRAYQEQLLREAVTRYGSAAEAARWVASPDRSAHVSGDAVDIGPSAAATWLSSHGAVYGLCQIYGNEPWHYELRPDAPARGCPPMYADPTQDPRMRG